MVVRVLELGKGPEPTLVKHTHCTLYLTFVQSFVSLTRGSKDIERTQNTVIQCLTFNFDLDLLPW